MRRLSIVVVALMILSSCGNKQALPDGILPPDKMQPVLWDIIRADAFTRDFLQKDSAKATGANVTLQKQIFAIHKTSKNEFYNSYAFYKDRPELMKTLLDSMISKANRERYDMNRANKIIPMVQ